MLEHRAAGIERSEQIDVDHCLETVGRHSQRRRGKVSCRAAHDEIDGPVLISRGLDRRVQRIIVADIGGMAGSFYTSFTNLFGSGVQFLLGAADKRDARSVRGKSFGNREVDSASAPGYDRALSCQQLRSKYVSHSLTYPSHETAESTLPVDGVRRVQRSREYRQLSRRGYRSFTDAGRS